LAKIHREPDALRSFEVCIDHGLRQVSKEDITSREQQLAEQLDKFILRMGRKRTTGQLTRTEALDLPVIRTLKAHLQSRSAADDEASTNTVSFDLG
ncbi:MAG: hypothetical protein HN348_31765, partial [Proteobacteria bacterium]|nr:hypothetical protein [Pseudomonadota bacterium]